MNKSSNTTWHQASVTPKQRQKRNGHRSAVIWFTGLSGSGKSTLAHAVEQRLHQMGCQTFVLDGDNIRHGLCSDLGFSEADRKENIRRIGEMVKLFADAGMIAITAFISPFKADRQRVHDLCGSADFIEIYCDCALEVCEIRDVKGIYKKARAGEISDFTGISSPYEAPKSPELIIETNNTTVEQSVDLIISLLQRRRVIQKSPNLVGRDE